MTSQILINILIAVTWMLLHEAWSVPVFVLGYLIGAIIIFGLRRFFPESFYGRKVWAILKLFYLFIVELVKSSIIVIGQIIRPKLNIEPGIFRTETILKTDWEITLLSALVTLTPGSVVMEVDPRQGIMYIHAMDAAEFKGSIMKSKRVFEEAIIEVMR
jgi:multicomponent Na+:H+ antiporter subunit E